MTTNTRKEKQDLYEVKMTRKGERCQSKIYIYAKNRLAAYNGVIEAGILGEIHEVNLYASAAWLDR